MQITGNLKHVGSVETVGKGTKKRTIALSVENGEYPYDIALDIFADKAEKFNAKVGNTLEVDFDVKSREYNGKWYTNATAWKWSVVGSSNQEPVTADSPNTNFDNEEDELPF